MRGLHPGQRAAIFSGGFGTPADDPDLYLWYDPNDSATVFTDSIGGTLATPTDVVKAIDNKEGTAARDATEATNPPTLTTVGGKNILSFDGTEILTTGTLGTLAAASTPYTIYAVVDCDVNDNTLAMLGFSLNCWLRRAATYQSYRGLQSFGALSGSGWHLLTHEVTAEANASLRQNGSVAVADYDPHSGWHSVSAFAMGDRPAGGINANVDIGAVVITTGPYNANIDAYLMSEFGI